MEFLYFYLENVTFYFFIKIFNVLNNFFLEENFNHFSSGLIAKSNGGQ